MGFFFPIKLFYKFKIWLDQFPILNLKQFYYEKIKRDKNSD